MKKPNILLFIADDHRHDAMSCAGDSSVKTPTMDKLAKEGTRFTQAHIQGSFVPAVCTPTRACLHSGVNLARALAAHYSSEGLNRCPGPEVSGRVEIPSQFKTLGERLRECGYHSFATGKWHNDHESFQRSFCDGDAIFMGGMHGQFNTPLYHYSSGGHYRKEHGYVANRHSSEVFSETAIRFIENYDDSDKPFFLYVAYTSPHDPKTAPEAFHNQYPADVIELPPNFMTEHPFDNGELQIRDEKLAATPRDLHEIRQHMADYNAMIAHQDLWMGKVLDALEVKGVAEDTIVVYLSDHGLAVGQHGLMGKQNLYEHSIRVPFIMKGPGIPRNEKRDAQFYSFDLYATLCEMLEIGASEGLDSQSILPVLRDPEYALRNEIYSAYKHQQESLKGDGFKVIRYYRDEENDSGVDKVQLFDLKNDPWEMHDLGEDPMYEARLSSMLDALAKNRKTLEDSMVG